MPFDQHKHDDVLGTQDHVGLEVGQPLPDLRDDLKEEDTAPSILG